MLWDVLQIAEFVIFQDIKFMPLGNVELVVLSVCNSATGGLSRTGGTLVDIFQTIINFIKPGLLGLAHAFIQAGARTVVATLWRADDNFTKDFMLDFYSNIFSFHSVTALS